MNAERGFERERDWTQGPAKWAAAVVLGIACILTSAWVMAGRVPIRNEPVRASGGSTLAPPAPTDPTRAPGPTTAITPPPPEPLGPAIEIVDEFVPPPEPQPVLPTTPAAPASSEPTSVARRVNINTASAAELELLPGVGPKLAERIVDHRKKHGTFKKVDDLDAVSGIGARTLERLRPLVTVD